MSAWKNLFVPNKMDYARGKNRPDVDCILCAIVSGDERVEKLAVYQSELFFVSLNLYPYTPGHLMVFPKRHIVDIRELTSEEVEQLHDIQNLCLNVLDKLYSPRGYNIGYNIGNAAGASIQHLHLHIVPRYQRELGFIDIIGGAKIIVEDPNRTQHRLRETFREFLD
jgi:ATP adenylyltransferase